MSAFLYDKGGALSNKRIKSMKTAQKMAKE